MALKHVCGRMRLHVFQEGGCACSNGAGTVLIVEWRSVHVAQQRAGGMTWKPKDESHTNWVGFVVNVYKERDGSIAIEFSLLSWVPVVSTNNRSIESIEGWHVGGTHQKIRNVKDKRKEGRALQNRIRKLESQKKSKTDCRWLLNERGQIDTTFNLEKKTTQLRVDELWSRNMLHNSRTKTGPKYAVVKLYVARNYVYQLERYCLKFNGIGNPPYLNE